MQHTEKLGLNLFEGTDPVLAESFNENTRCLEQNLMARPRMVTGSYQGDGSDAKTLTFDHKPGLVMIGFSDANSLTCIHGWPWAVHSSATGFGSKVSVQWDDDANSVTVESANSTYHTYYYTALLLD